MIFSRKVTAIAVSAVLTLGLTACGVDSGTSVSSESSDDSEMIIYNVTMTGKKLVDRTLEESVQQLEIHSEAELTFAADKTLLVPMYTCVEIHLKNYTASPTNWDLEISDTTEYQYDNGCIGNIEDTQPGMIAVTDSGTPAISFYPHERWDDNDSLRTIKNISVYFKYADEVEDGEAIPEDIDLLDATFSLNYMIR